MAKHYVLNETGKTLHIAPFFIDALAWAVSAPDAWEIVQGDRTFMREGFAITRDGARELSESEKITAYELSYFFEV